MLTFLVAVLSAAPTAGVALTQRSGVNRNLAMARAELVRAELGSERLSAAEDLTSCHAKKPCLMKAARERGWTVLVTVEAASVLQDSIVNVAVLSVDDDGKTFGEATATASAAKLAGALPAALGPAKSALDALLKPPPPVEPVRPTPVVEPTPEVKPSPAPEPIAVAPPPPPPLVVREVEPSRPAARWLPFGVSLAATAAGAVCFGASFLEADRLRSGTLTLPQIDAAVASGKFLQTFGLSALLAGSALSLGSLALALLWPEAPVTPAVAVTPSGGMLGVTGAWP